MAKIKTNKIKVETEHKCLLCFDTGEYFNGEKYVLCDHINNANVGIRNDEKVEIDNLEEYEDTD